MKYSDFRPRALLSTTLIIFFSLIFLSSIELMNSVLVWNISRPDIFLKGALIKNCAIGIPLIAFFSIWLYRFLAPLNAAFAALAGGQSISGDARNLALFRLKKLRRRLLAGNLALYGATAVISVIQGGFDSLFTPTGILQVVLYIVMSNIVAFIQTSLITKSVAVPRRLLAIHRIEGDSNNEIGLRARLILVNMSLVLFILVFTLYSGQSGTAKASIYTHYLEKISTGEITLDEAKTGFQNDGSKIIHVPPEGIIFPLDATVKIDHASRSLEGSLFLILFLLVITYLVEKIAADESVRQIQDASKKLSEMLDGSGDLTKRVEITQYDEVGHLVSNLNGLIESLQKVFIDVRQTSRIAAESAVTLGSEIESTAMAGERIAASVTQVAGNVETSLTEIEHTAKNLQEVFSSLDNIITSVDSQAAFVNETSGAVTEMAANVRSVSEATIRANGLATKLSRAAVEGNASVSDSIQAIKKVEEASKKVTEMVSVISQIASQTNLLAMNAAIEAAHAGEAGKGFAVVANEVRSLAESSAKSAKEITVQIKRMLETVRNGVDLSKKAGSALDDISTDIAATTGLVKQIADAMNEQSLATNDILSSITNLVEETQSIRNNAMEQKRRNDSVRGDVDDNTKNMKEIVDATKKQTDEGKRILASITDLKKIESQNRELSRKLSALVEGFRLD